MGNSNAKPNTGRPVDTTRKSIDSYKQQVLNRSRDPGIIYGPNVDVEDLYIDVLIHTERAQDRHSEMNRHKIYDVYMEVPSNFICLEEIRDLFSPIQDTKEKCPHSILAIGRSGIGKTVLTEKILRDWANITDEYYSNKIVFFFKLRWFNENINKLTNISLKTFLRLGTGLSEDNFEIIYEEIAKEPQKAILIFDGLDKFHGDPISCLDQSRIIPNDPNTGTSPMNLFIKLVLGDLLNGATVLVTSRPTADDFYSRLDFDRNVEILGFTSDKIEEYVSRFCHNNNTRDLETKIWNHIKSSSELLNLCYIPVNCFIVCVILSGCLSDPTNGTGALPITLTEIYKEAIAYFEKHHRRNSYGNSTAHEALKNLQRLAFQGMESGQLVFDQTFFDEQMKKSGLLNSLSNPIFPLQRQFCFIYLTIQEFLAARHVTETFAPPEIKKFISDHIESGQWHLVLQFIAGLLGKKIKNFDREYKDCVFAFAESFEVTHGKIELNYNEVFVMKCLREADDEEIAKEICESTAINDLVELRTCGFYNLSPSDWAAVTFVCKHMKNLANLELLGFGAYCLPEILALLRKRCLNKLVMLSHVVAEEIEQVFSALMELNCILDHKHTKLTSLTLKYFMSGREAGLPIKFFENGHASQLKQLTLKLDRFYSHVRNLEISKLCEVLKNGHCPNLTCFDLANNLIRDEGARELCDTLTKGLRKLSRLDVRRCELTDQCIPTLVKTLQDERCQLTDLSLGNNAIGDEGVGMLFEDALTKEHCKLTELNLFKCSLTHQCIPSLCKALQDERCQLTDLSLASNNISDKGVCMLFEDTLTKEHCKLTKLNLQECSLTDRCIPSLYKALQDERCELTKLWLRSNKFTENGWKLVRDIKNYESCKARGLQIEEPMDQDSKEGHGTHAQESSPELQTSSSQVRDAVDENYDTDTIKTSNTSDDAHLQDKTVDNVEQTDIKNRSIYDDKIASAEQLLILGISHETEGRNEEAIKSYEQAVQIADETDRNDIKSKAYQHLRNVFTGTSEYKKAIEYYQKARGTSPNLEGNEMEVEAYQWLAYNHIRAGQYQESIEYYNEVVKLASQLGDKERKINAYLGLGSAFNYTGDFESSRKYFLKALTVAEQLHDKILRKEAYRNLGAVYYKSCKFDAAVKSYLKVQEISHDLGERKEEANACLMLGDIFQELKQHDKAIESYQETFNICEELEDKEMQIVAIQRLGTLYLVCCNDCDYENAVEWYEKALNILGSQPNDHLLHVKVLTGLGDKELKDKEMQAVAIQRLGTFYLTLASVCCKDGDYEKAITWYENALNISGKEPNDHRLLHEKALTGLGTTLFRLGNTEKAMESIQKAQKFVKETRTDSPNIETTQEHKHSTEQKASSSPAVQDSKEGHSTHAQESSPGLQASSSQERGAIKDKELENVVMLEEKEPEITGGRERAEALVEEEACNPNRTEGYSLEELVLMEKYIKISPSYVYSRQISPKEPFTEKVAKIMTENVKDLAYTTFLGKNDDKPRENLGKFNNRDEQLFNFAKDEVVKNGSTQKPAKLNVDLVSYMKSIGQIGLISSCDMFPYGTCFLVADRMVITNHHVYSTIIEKKRENSNLRFIVRFDYPEPETGIFTVEVDENYITLQNSRLDYIFLLLKESLTGRVPLGPMVRNWKLPNGRVVILGHPGTKEMQEEVCTVIGFSSMNETIKKRRYKCTGVHMTNAQSLQDLKWKLPTVSVQDCLPYDTTLFNGCSGSPVIDMNGNIVAMHTQGYHLYRMDENISNEQENNSTQLNLRIQKYSLMEFGVQFTSIYKDMLEFRGEIAKQIFPNCNEPMDVT